MHPNDYITPFQGFKYYCNLVPRALPWAETSLPAGRYFPLSGEIFFAGTLSESLFIIGKNIDMYIAFPVSKPACRNNSQYLSPS
jgi:hypothetical protein